MSFCKKMAVIALLLTVLAVSVSANAAEPPALTVLVITPPDDLTISMKFEGTEEAVTLHRNDKAWEAYFRYFFHDMPFGSVIPDGGVTLTAESSEGNCEFTVSSDKLDSYNNVMTLDFKGKTLTDNQPAWREPLLVTLRIMLTLLIEGLIFLLFGYRSKAGWITFAVINLITQSVLNIAISGVGFFGYWQFGYILFEFVIFIVEMTAFPLIVKEHSKLRGVLYAFTANAVSLAVGGFVLANLPL